MYERVCFSPCGNYLAYFNAAGRLRVWETETHTLRNEFTPGSHLSSPCSSFAWVPVTSSPVKNKRKKRKYDRTRVLLLVLGTDAGQIFFFSIAENDVVASLKGHNRPVSAVTAAPGTDLYSSAANNIFQWDISTKIIKSKWKAEGNICNMAVSDDNSLLLTALSSSIVCWNVESRTELRKLEGHKSTIVSMCIGVSPSNETYAFSAAVEDRLVNVWNINNTSHDRAVAVLIVPDIPSGVSCDIDSNGMATLAAVSLRGSLHIYSHQLNGQCGKPIKPRTTVLVTSDAPSTSKKTELIPIMAAKVLQNNVKLIFGYAPFVNFETINLNTAESELFLVRSDPRRSRKQEEAINKVKTAETSGNVEYLGSSSINSVSLKRDRETLQKEQKRTMESLLEKMNLSSKSEPSSDALAHLLIQGLNSQDKDILRSVLLTQNERKIKSTVERLPAQAVLPLLKFLANLVQGRTWTSQVGALWLHALLRTHVSQLLADESCSVVIEPLLGLVETRLNCLGPLTQLKGRLNLLLDQTMANAPKKPVIEIQPLLVYQDNDSPANSNCLLEDDEESEGENDGDNDDDTWADLNEDMSVLESGNDDDNESEEGSNNENEASNDEEEMDASSSS